MTEEQRQLLEQRRSWSDGMDGELEWIIALLQRAREQWAGYAPNALVTAKENVESARNALRETMIFDGYDVETGTWVDWGNGEGL